MRSPSRPAETDRLVSAAFWLLGIGGALVLVVLLPQVREDPEPGRLSVDVLVLAEAVVSSAAGLLYAVAWARRVLGTGVETLAADVRRRTPGDSHLPRVPRPLRTIGLGYVLPMLAALVVLLVADPDDALFATGVTVPGQLFCATLAGTLGLLVVLPVLGLTRLVVSRQVRRYPVVAAVLLLLLLVVPWATLGAWAADSPYEGTRSPDWLLLLGVRRGGVDVAHPGALRVVQVLTYVIAGLLAYAGWAVRRGWAREDASQRPGLTGSDAP